jgi:biopolymer transport protein TolR
MARLRRRNANGNKPLSEINVTPLVDVVLVLLIIFMVTAPMLQMGIDVNLPRVKAKSINVSEEKLVLTINGKQEIYINEFKTTLPDLSAKLGFVVQVMSEVRKAGIDKLGMITEPPRDSR